MIYILYCQTLKVSQVQKVLQRYHIDSYIPKMEKYIASKEMIVDDIVMFPGYLFVDTDMNQEEFSSFLLSLHEEKKGIIRELKNTETTALTEEEMKLFSILYNKEWILKMSYGHKENKRTVVTEGPLVQLQDWVQKVDVRNGIAYLDVYFLNRKIQAGIIVTRDNNNTITS